MRRGFSIFLILFFGLGPLSAMIDGSEDAGLPPCCRRHGAHHCAMYARIMAMRRHLEIDPRPAFSVPLTCPLYHGPSALILMPAHALMVAAASPHIVLARSLALVFLRAAAHASPSRTHAGRGPPVVSLG
ncbi:MAG: hypothetical protein WB341_05565 [Terracidiphilus sp.]